MWKSMQNIGAGNRGCQNTLIEGQIRPNQKYTFSYDKYFLHELNLPRCFFQPGSILIKLCYCYFNKLVVGRLSFFFHVRYAKANF